MKTNMIPQVSIVVTCYNYGNFVAQCLDSLKKQTFSDFEVIIVDDGSTDNSSQQILPFLQDKRFRYIKQENGGQANAKNRGIKESRAELIAFLDADDLWAPEKLEKQLPLFHEEEVGVVYSRVSLIDNDGELVLMNSVNQYLRPRRGNVAEYFIYDNFVPFSSVIVRKICFETLGTFDESLAMGIDWDLWLRFSTMYKFDYCEDRFLFYRIGHSGQMSKNLLERMRCADRIVTKFQINYPDALEKNIIKNARYYSYCMRVYNLRRYGLSYLIKYFVKAILIFPLKQKAYISLVRSFVSIILGK